MVKRKVLEGMSNNELLKYIRPDSRFVAEAVELSFDILKKRNFNFDEAEYERITQLIESKKKQEPDYSMLNTWDIDEDAEKASINLYSQKAVWHFSVLFGTCVGAMLLAVNLFRVSREKEGWITLLFGIIYTMVLYVVYQITQVYLNHYSTVISILFHGIGASILQFWFWDNYLAGIKYKKRSVLFPLLICICFYAIIISVMVMTIAD